MDFSVILNWILGGGLLAAVIGIVTLKATLRKANAEAEKAVAEAETVRIDNAEHATRILIENIVEPLKQELNATRKDLLATKREMARLRKAVTAANSCRHSDDCPVLFGMRELTKDGTGEPGAVGAEHRGQHRVRSQTEKDGDSADVGGDTEDSDGQPHAPAL